MTGVQARPANTWVENGGFVGCCWRLSRAAIDDGRRESGDDEQGSDDG